ncbi:MAG: thiamine biosynthesis protein ThiH [Omnitrophica WOR_2 bacterium RIFCSPHIGHO2_02_FULL_52_10]|nr:MAG: thiamine biosynthesis protein ThiH [Omnitrophica WOR_2 bacterium RIFCSPHIGHO2_02_FULL_52_10]
MITLSAIKEILAEQDPARVEQLAQKSREITRQYFGRTISLYAPLYVSNYCSSHCTYCGFHSKNRITRIRLTPDQMRREMEAVAKMGIENILLLTGESYQATPLAYLKEAVQIAKKYFTSISLEVHPMSTDEYRALFYEGVDGITVYQETYDRGRYAEVHLSGKKSDYDYRRDTPRRAALAGIRQISLGILLGLGDIAEDLQALYEHLRWMEKNHPGIEYSLSFPRLRKIKGRAFALCDVNDTTLIKVLCLTRILFPRVGLNLSTRETPALRDHAIEIGVTRISAGSNTSVGGYDLFKTPEEQDPQFDIEDRRSVHDIVRLLKERQFDPVFTDWRPIDNA